MNDGSNPNCVGAKNLLKTAFTAFLLLLGGCATIIHGTRQDVGISSTPPDAHIFVDSSYVGETPKVVSLARGRSHTIRIELKGYQPFSMTLTSHVSGWVVGNLVFGGIVGLVVDATTGGMYCLSHDQVHALLVKQGTEISLEEGRALCATVRQSQSDWKKVGQMKSDL